MDVSKMTPEEWQMYVAQLIGQNQINGNRALYEGQGGMMPSDPSEMMRRKFLDAWTYNPQDEDTTSWELKRNAERGL